MTERIVTRVVPNPKGGWDIVRNSRTVSTHQKKATAVERARMASKADKWGHLVIHKKDGAIERRFTFGDDPTRRRGITSTLTTPDFRP